MRDGIARRAPAASRHGPAMAAQEGWPRFPHASTLRRRSSSTSVMKDSDWNWRIPAIQRRRSSRSRFRRPASISRPGASGGAAHPTRTGDWWGMTLVDVNPDLAERWRQFVDSIAETTPRVTGWDVQTVAAHARADRTKGSERQKISIFARAFRSLRNASVFCSRCWSAR